MCDRLAKRPCNGDGQFAEMLSGRYADVLSGLFLGYSTLWYASHHKHVKGLDKVTDFTMQVRRLWPDRHLQCKCKGSGRLFG